MTQVRLAQTTALSIQALSNWLPSTNTLIHANPGKCTLLTRAVQLAQWPEIPTSVITLI